MVDVIIKDSWTLIPGVSATKRMDYSCFERTGSTIPKVIRPFFSAENLRVGEKIYITLTLFDETFNVVIACDRPSSPIVRIRWGHDLMSAFKFYYPDSVEKREYPDLRFTRIGDDSYTIVFAGIDYYEGVSDLDDTPLESTIPGGDGEEGSKKQYYVTRYERDPVKRAEAIYKHGCRCQACGFDFRAKYGELGRNFIEVHHVVPLSTLDEPVNVDAETDLVCLCSNCHRMIHRLKTKVLSVEELQKHIIC